LRQPPEVREERFFSSCFELLSRISMMSGAIGCLMACTRDCSLFSVLSLRFFFSFWLSYSMFIEIFSPADEMAVEA